MRRLLPLRIRRWLPPVLGFALAGVAQAQGDPGETRCYRFDQPYFGQLRHMDGRSVPAAETAEFERFRADMRAARRERPQSFDPLMTYIVDSVRQEMTAIARLEALPADTPTFGSAAPLQWPPGTVRSVGERQRLVPVFILPEVTRRDTDGRVLFRRRGHYWQTIPGDSLIISWFNGLHGPVLRMAVRGDSLVGTVVHRTDVITTDSVTGRVVRPPALPARAARIPCAATSATS